MPYFVVISLVWACVTKRSIPSLLSIRFKYPYLILAPLVVQLFIIFVVTHRTPLITCIYVLSFICVIFGLSINYRVPGIKLILIGACLNLLAVSINHGTMPVYAETASLIHLQQSASHGSLHIIPRSAWDWWLVDWIPVPLFIMSPGDIFIGIGVIQFVLLNTSKRKE